MLMLASDDDSRLPQGSNELPNLSHMAIVLLRSRPKDSAPFRLMLDKIDQFRDQRVS